MARWRNSQVCWKHYDDTRSRPVPSTASADAERFRTDGVVTVTGGHAVNDTYTSFLPPLLPSLIQEFGLSTTQAGLLSVFLQWPSVLQPFIGYQADRFNLRYLVILAPAMTGIAMSLLGVAPNYAWLGILLIIAGISSAGIHSVGPVIAGGMSGSKLGRGMGFWMVGGGLGYTIGPLILVTTLQTAGIQSHAVADAGRPGDLRSAVRPAALRINIHARPACVTSLAPGRPRHAAGVDTGAGHHSGAFLHVRGFWHLPAHFLEPGGEHPLDRRRRLFPV